MYQSFCLGTGFIILWRYGYFNVYRSIVIVISYLSKDYKLLVQAGKLDHKNLIHNHSTLVCSEYGLWNTFCILGKSWLTDITVTPAYSCSCCPLEPVVWELTLPLPMWSSCTTSTLTPTMTSKPRTGAIAWDRPGRLCRYWIVQIIELKGFSIDRLWLQPDYITILKFVSRSSANIFRPI